MANRTFYRAAVRFHDRLFTLAIVALCLAGLAAGGMPPFVFTTAFSRSPSLHSAWLAAGGMPSMPGPSRTFLVAELKLFFRAAAPRDPGGITWIGYGLWLPVRGYP